MADKLINIVQKNLNTEYTVLLTGDATELTAANSEISGLAAERKSDVASTQLLYLE